MTQIKTTIELWQKGKWVIAKIPELDFVAQGHTIEEAKSNLREVIKIQIDEMRGLGTLEDYLAECGFEVRGDIIEPLNEMIGFEKQSVMVG